MGDALTGFIPPDHLLHLIQRMGLAPGKERTKLESMARSRNVDSRRKVLECIEKSFPGTVNRLIEDWSPARAQESVLMWSLTERTGLDSPAALLKTLGKRVSAAAQRQVPSADLRAGVRIPSSGKLRPGDSRVGSACAVSNGSEFLVYVGKNRNVHFEDQDSPKTVTSDVRLAVEMGHSAPIVRVHASGSDARAAFQCVLSFLWGKVVDLKGAEAQGLVRPMVFTETHIKSLKAKGSLAVYEFGGVSGKKDKRLRGVKMTGQAVAALDESDQDYLELDDLELSRRALYFPVKHPDQFVEQVPVRFVFDEKHPHITFIGRASRRAFADVRSLVYAPALASLV